MGGQPVLLLTTTGRRSGGARTTPVQFIRSGDRFVVVAANHGRARPPAWLANLKARPEASVQVGRTSINVRARVSDGRERARLWADLTRANRWLAKTEDRARRRLPVVVLDRR
jgi:deazaflavin-dependent oxidoreductase (nitroreductase family)